jgi:hypothetical protein
VASFFTMIKESDISVSEWLDAEFPAFNGTALDFHGYAPRRLHPRQVFIAELAAEFPGASTRSLGRIAYARVPTWFRDEKAAIAAVRLARNGGEASSRGGRSSSRGGTSGAAKPYIPPSPFKPVARRPDAITIQPDQENPTMRQRKLTARQQLFVQLAIEFPRASTSCLGRLAYKCASEMFTTAKAAYKAALIARNGSKSIGAVPYLPPTTHKSGDWLGLPSERSHFKVSRA